MKVTTITADQVFEPDTAEHRLQLIHGKTREILRELDHPGLAGQDFLNKLNELLNLISSLSNIDGLKVHYAPSAWRYVFITVMLIFLFTAIISICELAGLPRIVYYISVVVIYFLPKKWSPFNI